MDPALSLDKKKGKRISGTTLTPHANGDRTKCHLWGGNDHGTEKMLTEEVEKG